MVPVVRGESIHNKKSLLVFSYHTGPKVVISCGVNTKSGSSAGSLRNLNSTCAAKAPVTEGVSFALGQELNISAM